VHINAKKWSEILPFAQNDRLMRPDENFPVVKRSLFDQLDSFEGLNFEPEKYLKAILSRAFVMLSPSASLRTSSAKHLAYSVWHAQIERTSILFVRFTFDSAPLCSVQAFASLRMTARLSSIS
jgi:hypothetical protein